MEKMDKVKLSLPLKPEYAGTARLTVSGIASRMGFDFEDVEDIKVAVSEIMSKYIMVRKGAGGELKIKFTCFGDYLEIAFNSDGSTGCLFGEGDEFALSIIRALMDEVELCADDGGYQVIISKSVRENRI